MCSIEYALGAAFLLVIAAELYENFTLNNSGGLVVYTVPETWGYLNIGSLHA